LIHIGQGANNTNAKYIETKKTPYPHLISGQNIANSELFVEKSSTGHIRLVSETTSKSDQVGSTTMVAPPKYHNQIQTLDQGSTT